MWKLLGVGEGQLITFILRVSYCTLSLCLASFVACNIFVSLGAPPGSQTCYDLLVFWLNPIPLYGYTTIQYLKFGPFLSFSAIMTKLCNICIQSP